MKERQDIDLASKNFACGERKYKSWMRGCDSWSQTIWQRYLDVYPSAKPKGEQDIFALGFESRLPHPHPWEDNIWYMEHILGYLIKSVL